MDLLLPTDRRDRLLVALLAEDPAMVLLRWDPEVVFLFAPAAPLRVVLITVPRGAPEDRIRAAFSTYVKTVAQGSPPTHFVAVGGGPEVAAALASAAPLVQPVAMGFHHLDDLGALAHVKGKHLPLLERAAAVRPAAGAPFDAQPIAAALARGRKLAEQEQAVVARMQGRYLVTAVICAVCVVLAGLGYLWGGTGELSLVDGRMGANEVGKVTGGEPWRLLASAFLHANGFHLFVNMIALWSFGPLLEAVFGRRRYVLLYGASALGGSLASAFLHVGAHSSVGASGAIWGLMTAFIALAYLPRGVIPPQMAASFRRQAWVPFGINLLYSFQAGIDMLAHLGGGAVGFALTATVLTRGLVPMDQRRSPHDIEQRPRPWSMVAATLVAVVMGASIVAAIVTGRPWEVGVPPVLVRTPIADTGLSLEVPAELAKNPDVSPRKGSTLVGFGSLPDVPVAFEVVVIPLSRAAQPDEVDGFLEHQRAELDETAPAGWKRTAAARKVSLGGRPAILVEHDANEHVHVKTYEIVVGAQKALVRGYAGKDRPKAWLFLEEKVAASLR